MKKLLLAALAAVALIGCTGCGTLARNAYRAESITCTTVESAMYAWGDYVAHYHPSVSQELKVQDVFRKYKAAELMAIDATAAYALAKGDATKETAMQIAISAVTATLGDLVELLSTYNIKLKT